MSKILKN